MPLIKDLKFERTVRTQRTQKTAKEPSKGRSTRLLIKLICVQCWECAESRLCTVLVGDLIDRKSTRLNSSHRL